MKETGCIGSKRKQKIVVSDSMGSTTLQLWDKSYCLQSFSTVGYDGIKYLTLCRDGSKIVVAKDIVDACTACC